MAIASQSLINMSASDMNNGNQTLLMPKLQYRFRVSFLSFGASDALELTRQVVDCARPNVQFAKITLPVYNSTVYMAGKHTWQPLNVNIRDDASGFVSRSVGEQLQKQLDFIEQSSAASASDYKFSMQIDILDGGNGGIAPVVLERWELYGCYVESVNYNALNYGQSEDIKIALTIQFDNAVQASTPGVENDPTGVGVAGLQARTFDGVSTSVGTNA
jgi:hypothetical protein